MTNIFSNCCGVSIINENDGEGICANCKEHCVVITEKNSDRIDNSINKLKKGVRHDTTRL